jgi:hypothetical protein
LPMHAFRKSGIVFLNMDADYDLPNHEESSTSTHSQV